MIAVAALLQLLILAGALYDTARLLGPGADPHRRRRAGAGLRRGRTGAGPHRAARARRRRAALETAERRLVERRLHGRIDAVTYREAMHALAEGRRAGVWRYALAEGAWARGWRQALAEGRRGLVWPHPNADGPRARVWRLPLAEGPWARGGRHPRAERRRAPAWRHPHGDGRDGD
ncbi:hypothetical protein PO587_10960 [Streptomyces gilvifuscus]|uniref:Uncharacterized protein n=1 Tax=Streptomyces gilvifuscus TaxID=1550617 RepID=A0ABT5FR77_9ACTN|nr:hypothetical protein [Streptomyces gilvifuscus]MDC2954986.1 hypothetical protein [Streptomyces gilvifuscus]